MHRSELLMFVDTWLAHANVCEGGGGGGMLISYIQEIRRHDVGWRQKCLSSILLTVISRAHYLFKYSCFIYMKSDAFEDNYNKTCKHIQIDFSLLWKQYWSIRSLHFRKIFALFDNIAKYMLLIVSKIAKTEIYIPVYSLIRSYCKVILKINFGSS